MLDITIENDDFEDFNEIIKDNNIKIDDIVSLELIECNKIKILPKIPNLKELIIKRCDNFKELPKECDNIEKLILYGKNNKSSNVSNVQFTLGKPFELNIPNSYIKLKELILNETIINYIPNVLYNLQKIKIINSYINYISLLNLPNLNYLSIFNLIENIIINDKQSIKQYLEYNILNEQNFSVIKTNETNFLNNNYDNNNFNIVLINP